VVDDQTSIDTFGPITASASEPIPTRRWHTVGRRVGRPGHRLEAFGPSWPPSSSKRPRFGKGSTASA